MSDPADRLGRPTDRSLDLRRVALVIGAAETVTVTAYGPALRSWFVSDDFEKIYGATHSGPLATDEIHSRRSFRPLDQALLELSHRWSGMDPAGYHVLELLLHLLAYALVVVVARALLTARALRFAPLLAGSVFLVKPNQIEPVAWISARGNLTMTCFILLTVFLMAARHDRTAAHPRTWRLGASGAPGARTRHEGDRSRCAHCRLRARSSAPPAPHRPR